MKGGSDGGREGGRERDGWKQTVRGGRGRVLNLDTLV